jgi:hypothetical protein
MAAALEAERLAAQTEAEPPETVAVKARSHFLAQFQLATGRGDAKAAIGYGGLALRANEQIAAMQGRINGGGTTVNVGVAVGGGQENLQVAIAVLRALQPFPEARQAVLVALSGAGVVPMIEGEAAAVEVEGAAQD